MRHVLIKYRLHSRIKQRSLRARALRAVVPGRRAVRDGLRGRHGAAVAGRAGPRVRPVAPQQRTHARRQRVQGGGGQLIPLAFPYGGYCL